MSTPTSNEFPPFSNGGGSISAPRADDPEFIRALEQSLFQVHKPENDLRPDPAALAFRLRNLENRVDLLERTLWRLTQKVLETKLPPR